MRCSGTSDYIARQARSLDAADSAVEPGLSKTCVSNSNDYVACSNMPGKDEIVTAKASTSEEDVGSQDSSDRRKVGLRDGYLLKHGLPPFRPASECDCRTCSADCIVYEEAGTYQLGETLIFVILLPNRLILMAVTLLPESSEIVSETASKRMIQQNQSAAGQQESTVVF
ncbi:unnamed protein product [Protopolystoma xenopodis]|uniref:Uncharacterized protein n=1 Tax=Protopolystoma xenopodis TaxID=117903 RepID=A0A448XNR5_9PLAT|nr:unnamed protein product [Protopolystoma xenopodis]